MTLRNHLIEFHAANGLPMGDEPRVPADDRVRLRAKLNLEEAVKEFFEACFDLHEITAAPTRLAAFKDAISTLSWLAQTLPVRVDLVKIADALADAAYVVEGACLEFGIDSESVLDEVHRSNMTKRGAPLNAAGKLTKGENYVPPDIAGVLERQRRR